MCSNIEKPSEYACSGCAACCSLCPQGAVYLQLDQAGFYAAQVDSEKCIHCGLCLKVCSRYEDQIKGISLYDSRLYALQSSNKSVVRKCSSGGIAHEIAAYLIRSGWKAAGAVYNYDTHQVEHRIVSREEDLYRLDGSKYLQSNPQRAFQEVQEELKKNQDSRFVIFGTPCQIAGLAKCGIEAGTRNRMLLVEIFCHGVPSYYLWEEERRKISRKLGTDSFDNLQFRHKKDDWHSYCLRADGGSKTFYGARERELFWQVFFENVLLGDSCYTCRLRKEISMADLRLGDYWGRRFQNRSDGVSAVFACSENGRRIIDDLLEKKYAVSFEPGTAEQMLAAQNMEGYHQNALHDEAMNVLREEGNIHKAVRVYRKKLPIKLKVKRTLLQMSAVIPDRARASIRKYYSVFCIRIMKER